MEFNSTSSNMKKISGRGNFKTSSIFMELADEYSKAAQQQIDPNQLQEGQSVYNEAGEEYIVVDDPEGTTNKVLMPASQQGQPVPEVETVEDVDISTSYTVQSPETAGGVQMTQTAKKAQMEEDIDWDEIESTVIDLNAFTKRRDMLGVTATVEELTNIILSHMELPEDLSLPPMISRLVGKHVARRAKKNASLSTAPFTQPRVASNPPEAKKGAVEVLPEFRKESVIKKLLEKDKDPNKPASEQEYGLYTSDGSRLLGRHPSKEKAEEQEAAIKAKGGSKFKDVLPEFKNVKFASRNAQTPETSVYPDVTSFHEPVRVDTRLNPELKDEECEEDKMTLGIPGFTDIMDDISEMVDRGYEVVDVILAVGEKYPRDQGTKVLEEARKEGIL